jgi:hypothetical protein
MTGVWLFDFVWILLKKKQSVRPELPCAWVAALRQH